MRYFGGKAKISKYITSYINNNLKENQTYIEPFIGGGWIMCDINSNRKRIGNDLCKPLIEMYKSLQKGWIPPNDVDTILYQQAKSGQLPDDITAFIGFGCSFAGKWFGGHATSKDRNYAMNAKNSLMKKMKNMQDVEFTNLDYRLLTLENCFIYADPPYSETTKYDYCGKFDSEAFWNQVRIWSKNNTVVISEYNAPEDFEVVLEMPKRTDIRGKNGKLDTIEKLFKIR